MENFVMGKPIRMCIVKTIDLENVEQLPHDYVSEIVECIDNKVLVELPTKHGCPMRVNNSDIIHIMGPYINEYGSAYTHVTDIIKDDGQILVLELISKVKCIQRRKLYRLSLLKDIKFKLYNYNDISEEYPACLVDISGGGAAISTEQDINEGSSILLQIDLDGEKIEVCGNIIRKLYNEDKNNYKYGVCFNSIDRNHQDKIIQYIHREQARSLKRGIRE